MVHRSIIAGLLMAGSLAAAPAAAQSVEELAKQLAQPAPAAAAPAEPACAATLPDGSCADQPDTRQMVLRRPSAAAASVASTVSRVIRADINMSFLVGSAELTNQARATLDRFAAALVRAGSYRPFTVEGHTDRSGSPATNRVLSQARAASVVNYLVSKGVDRSRLTAQGYGYERPLPGRSADDPANRRVEVVAR
ncbi:OmpA family protein [Sandarakinorhabdus oryzae]|uniref:OmpA family protein n=1 Tax=Sandarakinorhabdus oryzae TaxID=2675220 RepID=UPI0018CC5BE6|nr:OmpA family protein [Sandarakinorhabdus oryzae]